MEQNKNIAKDFGNWTVPTSWQQVTLRQFSDIKRYMAEKDITRFDVRAVLHILTNHTEDEVDQLPLDFSEELLKHLMFMQEEPEVKEPTNKMTISGVTYQVNFQEQMKLGEYVACDAAMRNDKYDYPSIMAILCRKEGELFDARYQNEVFDERKKMFEQAPMTEAMRVIAFFLQCWLISDKTFLRSLKEEARESLNLIAQSLRSSTEHGAFKRRYLSWRIRKLQKLLR